MHQFFNVSFFLRSQEHDALSVLCAGDELHESLIEFEKTPGKCFSLFHECLEAFILQLVFCEKTGTCFHSLTESILDAAKSFHQEHAIGLPVFSLLQLQCFFDPLVAAAPYFFDHPVLQSIMSYRRYYP